MFRELSTEEVIYNIELDGSSHRSKVEYIPEYSEIYDKIKSALEIDKSNYNVYFIDDFSEDKLKNIMQFIGKILENKKSPKDICYVVKEDSKYPKVLFLSNGGGNKLKETVERIQNRYLEITYEFYNGVEDKEKETIINNIEKKRNELVGGLEEKAGGYGFEVRITGGGFVFIPVKEGAVMTEKEYERLGKEKREEILDKVSELKGDSQVIFSELKKLEEEEVEKLRKLMRSFYNLNMKELKEEYYRTFKEEEVLDYLDFICSEIEEGIIEVYSISYEDDEEKINELIANYDVNVLVDNSENVRPGVIFEEDPSLNNLLGSIEYENHNNVYTTDVSLIKGGSLLKANEGCLIIRFNSLLSNSNAYYYLKKSLMSGKVDLDYNRGYLELLSLNGLKPEPIDIKVKVILIGDYETYDLLYNYDEDFRKIFRLRAEYNPLVDINDNTKNSLVTIINSVADENGLKPLKLEAIKEVAKYLSRKAENKYKLFFDNNELRKILTLASNRVSMDNRDLVEAEDVISAVYYEETIERELLENYTTKKLLVNVKDKIAGQINGLSVIDTGYFSFGKPIKITCSCYKGEGNIIDVQKESNLSGNIHSKSINILKGYLNSLNSGYTGVPVDFHISFEQLYGKIDGDSASVAEAVCMISALSKLPVKQNIAVTGSINQFGEVQPIGGVNEKIEGFYKVCRAVDEVRGKGVLIPLSNKDDLVLSSEVENAVKRGEFHIYTMETIPDALEILMGDDKITTKEILSLYAKEMKKYYTRK